MLGREQWREWWLLRVKIVAAVAVAAAERVIGVVAAFS